MAEKDKSPVRVISAIMAITLIGKVLGLIREILIGAAFGSTGEGAAFTLASTIPRSFLDITFASAISGCFIPVFASALEKKGKDEAYKLANTFITLIFILTTVITVIAIIFSNGIATLMGPGYPADTQLLAGKLFKLTLPIIILSAVAFSFIGVLQSMGEFNIPAAMSIISNGCIIIYCLFFVDSFGVYGLAAVFLLGWSLQIAIQIPALIKIKYSFKFSFNFKNPLIKEMAALVLPVMISTWVMPVNNMVNLRIATYVNESASVAYSKADALYSVITGVFVLSIANFVFPQLTKINAREEDEEFGKTLAGVLRSLFYFLIPMTVGLFLLSSPLSRMFFLAGKFDEFSVALTADALSYFSIGILGFGLQTILSRAFYAQKNAVVPLLTGIAAVLINAALSTLLKNYLGIGGPALASSVSFSLTAAVMLYFMYRKNRFILNYKMLKDLLLICISAFIMGVTVKILYGALDLRLQAGTLFDLVRVGLPVLLGVAVYFSLTIILRINEARAAINIVRGFSKRRA